jgi:C4-dicarboxylate-specific signal transduction histidine kinase
METKAIYSTATARKIAIGAAAFAIFGVDTQTDVNIDIPVLYVAVVLASVRVFERRGVVIMALVCIVFTVVGYVLSPGDLLGTTALANRLLDFLAIGATTYLALRGQSTNEALRKAQTELAHVTRVMTLEALTASIAHEVTQPLAAVVTGAQACMRWFSRDTPDLDEARSSLESIIEDSKRASEVVQRVRTLANNIDIKKVPLDINDVINEVVPLVRRELISYRVSLRMELAPALPLVLADRIQIQQAIINLLINGLEAMQPVTDRPRELLIGSGLDETHRVLVSVTDCGVGISAENTDRLFDAFFTTKSSGMGMGLPVCRRIVEAYGGRLSVSGNVGAGATSQFVLPAQSRAMS